MADYRGNRVTDLKPKITAIAPWYGGIVQGDARTLPLPDKCVHMCLTSPPYWGLRDYGVAGQIGLERTPEEFVAAMVAVFREVWRVLRDDAVLFLNLGDSYATGAGKVGECPGGGAQGERWQGAMTSPNRMPLPGLKPKDLVGIPWAVAKALQAPFYAGRIKRLEDRVWLAAMLDAEGCMFIQKRKAGQHNGQGYYRTNDSYGPGVEISNTSLALVERIQSLVGLGSICSQGPEENGRRKQRLYRWNLRTTECREFVRELYPHLVAKQQQARILIGCPSSGERAEAAHAALIALHRTGQSDIDFPAPESLYSPGWYLRSEIIWAKPSPMPESVTDRPTKAHEQVFLLSKRERYFYDSEAVREEGSGTGGGASFGPQTKATNGEAKANGVQSRTYERPEYASRNLRTVWTIPSQPFPGSHFATFPRKLAERCILAGTSAKGCCPACGAAWVREMECVGEIQDRWASTNALAAEVGGTHRERNSRRIMETFGWRPTCSCPAHEPIPCTVLDPFAGAGTTGVVAEGLGRRFVGVELNHEYAAMAKKRIERPHADLRPAREKAMPLFGSAT